MRRFALALYASTALISSATMAGSADVNRVPELCAKRTSCNLTMLASADIKPAVWNPSVAQQRNPDPFHQFTPSPPTTAQAQAPAQQQPPASNQQPNQQQPNVFVQTPPQQRDLFDWILLALGGIFTAIFGIRTSFDRSKIGDGQIDPNVRLALLQLAQRGVNSPVVDNMLNFPGEDIVERIANKVIERRIQALSGGNPVNPNERMTIVPADKLGNILDFVARQMNQRTGQTTGGSTTQG